jgi:hypothetical protein
MADQRQMLTDKSIARLPLAGQKQYKVHDTELPGFFVLIGKRRKSSWLKVSSGVMVFASSRPSSSSATLAT